MTIRRAAGRAGRAACGAALVVAREVALYRRAVPGRPPRVGRAARVLA